MSSSNSSPSLALSSSVKTGSRNSSPPVTFTLPNDFTTQLPPSTSSSSSSRSSSVKSLSESSTSPSSSSSFSYYHISILVVILLFVGVNVFFYLGAITQYVRDLFAPIIADIMRTLGYVVTSTASTTASTAATGAKTGIDVASGTIVSGIDVLQGQLDTEAATTQHDGTGISTKAVNNEIGDVNDKGLNTALSHAEDESSMYMSRNGEANFTGKNGFCFVGEDRGFRSCVSVKPDDTCMSGDIFPSMDICINPSLRE